MSACPTYLKICDPIPDNITVLQFKINNASTAVKVRIIFSRPYERSPNEFYLEKTTDPEGVFSIQLVTVGDTPAELTRFLFNKYNPWYRIRIQIGNADIPVTDENNKTYSGIAIGCASIQGYPDTYLIDLSTGVTVDTFDITFDTTIE